MDRADQLEALNRISVGQWGLFTTAQALRVGFSKMQLTRLADSLGFWRIREGVYQMPGWPAGETIEIKANWLAFEPEKTAAERLDDPFPVAVSHESACLIWGIGDFLSPEIYFTSPQRRQTRQENVKIHTASFPGKTIHYVDSLAVTSPRRSLEDVAKTNRWDDQQLRSAIFDALNKKILTNGDVSKSKILSRLAPELAEPASDQSVRRLLANDAKRRNTDVNTSYTLFHRALFCDRLCQLSDQWILKGGTGMVLRGISTRTTRDLDLIKPKGNNLLKDAAQLVELMNGQKVGRYTYRIKMPENTTPENANTLKLHTRILYGESMQDVGSFSIDVTNSQPLTKAPKTQILSRGDQAVVPGYSFHLRVRMYPIENQIADKICALYESHANQASTRFRDLYDLALLGKTKEFDLKLLAQAIRQEALTRSNLNLPEKFIAPSPHWPAQYNKVISKTKGTDKELTDFDTAMHVVSDAFNPALTDYHQQANSRNTRPDEIHPDSWQETANRYADRQVDWQQIAKYAPEANEPEQTRNYQYEYDYPAQETQSGDHGIGL